MGVGTTTAKLAASGTSTSLRNAPFPSQQKEVAASSVQTAATPPRLHGRKLSPDYRFAETAAATSKAVYRGFPVQIHLIAGAQLYLRYLQSTAGNYEQRFVNIKPALCVAG